MQKPNRHESAINRRRFLSLSGQTALAFTLAQLIPVRLLAEEALPELPPGLLRMGRDVFPHDAIDDAHYARPLAELANEQPKLVADGLADLNRRAIEAHDRPFEALDEAQRVALLTEVERSPFFKAVRGSLMFGLYDNKALFPLFGYQGSSWEYGGYVNRGFDDLNWL
ncbi:gluconate 2-dehydrogenase subunit 3 family protein [Pseudomonas phenolilytica]|uniref:gluconate 2-dehydrogenase subunit 3 family protein n=1 Tax=Pseudomonas phenolilytica TaxID=2746321 RepID=UPI001F24F941|nr:gluconate 2-dehydrogenase subunit 3 family protein [Pseudomonas phenolilytica]UIP87901.1 gluconate 2-dehydrogenase subunit 3 family protein [Pseudomonas phenolilytica]